MTKHLLFCGDPFLSHESMGGLIEYSSSSTSGVAVGTVIDDAVNVGVAMLAWDDVGCPETISGFNDPPDTADNVSSFSSLKKSLVKFNLEHHA